MAFKNLNKKKIKLWRLWLFVFFNCFLLQISSWPSYASDVCEEHNFGDANTQQYVLPGGIAWNFEAENSMLINEIRIRSVLATPPEGGTFHIQVKINDTHNDPVASWSQYVEDENFLEYRHSSDVSLDLNEGDAIFYFIYV